MREIKFRAWDGFNREMIGCYEPILFNKVMPLCMNESGGKYESSTGLSSYYLMQYTGMKDKNGVKIYEGDIVVNHYLRRTSEPSVVAYDCQLGFVPAQIPVDYDEVYSGGDEWEVIGNIYENPELLEGVK